MTADEQKGLIEGFDHTGFAKSLASQAAQVIPDGIGPEDKKFVVDVVYKFCLLAGDALNKDAEITINAQQACLISQFIGEWTFHKSVDLIKSGIDPNLREGILQKIAFTVFEIAKQAVIKHMPQEQIIPLVEHHVNISFKEVIADLEAKGVIDSSAGENILKQSNIDEMAKTQAEAEIPGGMMSDSKILKLASLAMLIKNFDDKKIEKILSKFNKPEADVLIQYLQMPDLETKIDSDITKKCFEEMRCLLPEPKVISADKFYNKLLKIAKKTDRNIIANIVKNERPLIKDFAFSPYEKKEVEIPARIAGVICSYIEEKVV